MKKVLLGTTALIAGGLAAVPAMAADPIKIGVGGYMQQYFNAGHYGGTGVGATATDYRTPNYKYEGEIWFIGQTKLDNGTTVGVRFELEGWSQSGVNPGVNGGTPSLSQDTMDEEYIFAFGDWGRIDFGGKDVASYVMFYGAPNALPGYGATQFNFGAGSASISGANGALHQNAWSAGVLGVDANRLTYYTPRFFGLQFGVSYTPQFNTVSQAGAGGAGVFNAQPNAAAACGFNGGAGNAPLCNSGQNAYVNGISLSVNYVNKFGDLGIAASFGWDHAAYDAGIVNSGLQATYNALAGGLNISYAGFTVGGSFGWDNNGLISGNANLFWSAGIMYETGPWAASFTYFGGSRRENVAALAGTGGAVGTDQIHLFMLGGTYAIGPGIKLVGGFYYEAASGQNQSERTDSWQFLIGTELRF
ncbi:MAG: porin [Alphaproteobacteria bacterium]|nr:porin [Alphaproteobacteria bacterium]